MTVILLFFVACEGSVIYSTFTIDDEAGGGTKTITLKVNNVFGELDLSYDDFLAAIDKMQDKSPLKNIKIYTVEDEGGWAYIVDVVYSFDDIDDYNYKTRLLAEVMDLPYEDAVIHVEGDQVTFKEKATNFRNSIEWIIDAVYNDPELFDNSDISYEDFVNEYIEFQHIRIKIGEDNDFVSIELDEESAPEYYEVSGKIEKPVDTGQPTPTQSDDEPTPAQSDEPTPPQSPATVNDDETVKEPTQSDSPDDMPPKTHDYGNLCYVIVAMVALMAMIINKNKAMFITRL